MNEIVQRLENVRENMALAIQRSGRKADEVSLCAVTKFVEIERIALAADAGVKIIGENRAQEFSQKLNFYKQRQLQAHFIGQLQTNKVKYICGNADLIQSVDRENLLEAIQIRAQKLSIIQPILIQVNIGDEPQKGGVPVSEIEQFTEKARSMPNLKLRGFMCVPPAVDTETVRPYFRSMYELYEKNRKNDANMDILSMGMSHDYTVAIEEGATLVRVGTAIFGARQIQGGISLNG